VEEGYLEEEYPEEEYYEEEEEYVEQEHGQPPSVAVKASRVMAPAAAYTTVDYSSAGDSQQPAGSLGVHAQWSHRGPPPLPHGGQPFTPRGPAYRDMYSTHPPPHQRRFIHQHQRPPPPHSSVRYADHFASHTLPPAAVYPDDQPVDYARPDYELDYPHYHLYEDEVCYQCDSAAAAAAAAAAAGNAVVDSAPLSGRSRHPAGSNGRPPGTAAGGPGELDTDHHYPPPPSCDSRLGGGSSGTGGGRRLPQIPQQPSAPRVTVWGGPQFGYEDEQDHRRQVFESKQRSLPRTPHDRQPHEEERVKLPRRPLSAQVSPRHYAAYAQGCLEGTEGVPSYGQEVPAQSHHHHLQQQQQPRRLGGGSKQLPPTAARGGGDAQHQQQRRKLPRIVSEGDGGGVSGGAPQQQQLDDLPRRQPSPGRPSTAAAAELPAAKSGSTSSRLPSSTAVNSNGSNSRRGTQQQPTSHRSHHRSNTATAGTSSSRSGGGSHHHHHHSRTKSESGVLRTGTGRSGTGRTRMRRQSPVEERLSVHEDDSMSDAFDDDGLFQIDENFAKFLDDKTSCQK
jgi:hypothetical protein